MVTSSILDVGPVNVRGALRARLARVVWSDGTLHVVSQNGSKLQHQTLETSEPVPPKRPEGYWRTESAEGAISWSKRGCSG